MKKLLPLFFFLFLVGALSAQNINFKDTNGIKTLLCSHTWLRYYVNPDSSFSDRVMDSVTFYKDGTFFKSSKPKDDTSYTYGIENVKGTWHINFPTKTSGNDSTIINVSLIMQYHGDNTGGFCSILFVDGHRIYGLKSEKIWGKVDGPFIADTYYYKNIGGWNTGIIWQARRQFKKPKKHQ